MSTKGRRAAAKPLIRFARSAAIATTTAVLAVSLAGAGAKADPSASPTPNPHSSAQQSSVSTYLETRATQVAASRARRVVSLTKSISLTKYAIAHAHVNGVKVIKIAARYKGVPYRAGGSTPRGFDCSGFTQFVFNKIGISLPRVAQDQLKWTTPISAKNARPGDLVFYMSGKYAYHAAIYAGNGMIWHSPRSGERVTKVRLGNRKVKYGKVPANVLVPSLQEHLTQLETSLKFVTRAPKTKKTKVHKTK